MSGAPPTRWLEVVPGERVAYTRIDGGAPTCVFLGGFRSDMSGIKATWLRLWCARQGFACVCLDYRGHGLSDGLFESLAISDWLEDARAVIAAAARGPVVLVGSSMGAWIALLLAREAASGGTLEVAGLMGLAAAPDFTEVLLWPRLTAAERAELQARGVTHLPSRYGDGPYPISRKLIEDGRRNLVLDTPLVLDCTVRLLHGTADPDVPWSHSAHLLEHLSAPQATLTLLREGDHRLSTPAALVELERALASLV